MNSSSRSDLIGLYNFLRESLAIEGINRGPTPAEIDATARFLAGRLTAGDVIRLQAVYAPGIPLRNQYGMDVRVGNYKPLGGHPSMPDLLAQVLLQRDPYRGHVAFETLHPFMDGNGRTGRAIWAWLMLADGQNPFALTFLHRFYYQVMAASEGRI